MDSPQHTEKLPTAPGWSERAGLLSEPWYVVHVRNRWEQAVAAQLGGRGYAAWLPQYTSRRRWSDRFKEIQLPLFPGYVFCQLDPHQRLPVLSIPGVVQIVGVGRTPVPVDPAEFKAIQASVKSGGQMQPWPWLQAGNRVRIESGPLCGVEGILLEFRGTRRVIISVTLLQRSVAVQVETNWVRPLPG